MKTINNTELKLIKGKWCLNGKPYTGIGKADDATFYYEYGNIHRDNDLPAVEWANGDKSWCMNGNHHRDNGLPAVEYADGSKEWWINGNRHRDNGLPAVEYADGSKEWWVNDKRHRDNGLPAIEWADGTKAWYVNGNKIYSWEQYQKATNCSKEELVMYILTHGNIS